MNNIIYKPTFKSTIQQIVFRGREQQFVVSNWTYGNNTTSAAESSMESYEERIS